MIGERALWMWAEELAANMGDCPTPPVKRVLEYAYAFGTLIPERFLIDAFRSFHQDPPSRKIAREVLSEMGMIPKA